MLFYPSNTIILLLKFYYYINSREKFCSTHFLEHKNCSAKPSSGWDEKVTIIADPRSRARAVGPEGPTQQRSNKSFNDLLRSRSMPMDQADESSPQRDHSEEDDPFADTTFWNPKPKRKRGRSLTSTETNSRNKRKSEIILENSDEEIDEAQLQIKELENYSGKEVAEESENATQDDEDNEPIVSVASTEKVATIAKKRALKQRGKNKPSAQNKNPVDLNETFISNEGVDNPNTQIPEEINFESAAPTELITFSKAFPDHFNDLSLDKLKWRYQMETDTERKLIFRGIIQKFG